MGKIAVGFIFLVILTASLYVVLPDRVRIDVKPTTTTYQVFENNIWTLAATESVTLFDGSKKMLANNREITQSINGDIIEIKRTATWKDNITTIQTYIFDGSKKDVEFVPVSNKLQCFNCKGKILQYEYRNILYDGETKDITAPFSFGHNMKIDWIGSYYSKVFQQLTSDKILIKFKPQKDYEVFDVRLFDPPWDFIYSYKTVQYLKEEKTTKEYQDVDEITYIQRVNQSDNSEYLEASVKKVNKLVEVKTPIYGTKEVEDKIIGVRYYGKEILNSYVQDNILSVWEVPVGDRNFEEFGRCRQYEIEKGVCTERAI